MEFDDTLKEIIPRYNTWLYARVLDAGPNCVVRWNRFVFHLVRNGVLNIDQYEAYKI